MRKRKLPPEPIELERQMAEIRARADAEMFRQIMARPLSGLTGLGGVLPQPVQAEPKPPSVDSAKLEALKTVEPRKVLRRAPDYVHVLTAWRAWDVKTKDGQLRLEALGRSVIWEPKKQIEATCVQVNDPFARFMGAKKEVPAHSAPQENCTCGVWAFKELDGLVAAVGNKYSQIRVLGKVSLWGRVVETQNGYRAQYAYPSELWLLDNSLEELGLIYDVPVRTA